MRVALIGADLEENLGVGMIAAEAAEAGHRVWVIPFNDGERLEAVAAEVLAAQPEVVGLSIQFQHRAREFLGLARKLRRGGYGGHITCGGQMPSSAYQQVLSGGHGVDSVVLYDGEKAIVALLGALSSGRALSEVPGLALLSPEGKARRTAARRIYDELDRLPFAHRYRAPSKHLGVPFLPIMGSRGCWGSCSFCSITTHYREARREGGGKMLRERSPDNIAAEMALLCEQNGGRALFCFHDDNFLRPKPAASLARVRAIREAFDAYELGPIGLIGKCRPDSMTHELAGELADLGVIRLYVGVENTSPCGSEHLNRQLQTERVHEALEACKAADIFACYNLLLFEPDASLADVEHNVQFIRDHADRPVNFCRAEPYHGTPLQTKLASEGRLTGSYLGYDYRIGDDRVELLFRICAAAFRERNFAPNGVHNRYMGAGYRAKVLERFYEDSGRELPAMRREATRLTRSIANETAAFLQQAIELARSVDLDDHDRVARETALLGLSIAEADRYQHARLDELFAQMDDFAARSGRPAPLTRRHDVLVRVAQRMAQGVALGTLLAAWGVNVGGCSNTKSVPVDSGPDDKGTDKKDAMVVDPLPPDAQPDAMVVDPLPPDAQPDTMVVDPLPPDARADTVGGDPLPPDTGPDDAMVVDPLPPDTGNPPPDPPPPDQGVDPDWTVVDPPPPPPEAGDWLPVDASASLDIDKWRDTAPRNVQRSDDLPLFHPPEGRLIAASDAGGVRVRLSVRPESVSTRWESDGRIEGEGLEANDAREVMWYPESDTDQLRVGIRSTSGVAILSLRASSVA